MSDLNWTDGEWWVNTRTTNGVNGYEICWSKDEECVTDHVYEKADADLMAASKKLYMALHDLEVMANTATYCFGNRPENFAMALKNLEQSAESAREVLSKARGEQ